MTFGGNTRDLGSFGEETDEITDLHQILEEVLLVEREDSVSSIKRRCHDPSSDDVIDLVTASGRELRNALTIEPPPHVFKKKSLIAMGVIMELHNGGCCWPATPEAKVKEEDDGDDGGDEAVGGGIWVMKGLEAPPTYTTT
ncbi:hypothetical protein Tco_0914699 [Tanacetum coccineum]